MCLKDVAHREVRETLHLVCETMQHSRLHCNILSPLRLTAVLKEFCIHSKVLCIHSKVLCIHSKDCIHSKVICIHSKDTPTLKADSSTQRHRTLQHTATHCNPRQQYSETSHTATLQHNATHDSSTQKRRTLQHTATHCNTLQHTTAVLKDVAHCNTLQHTATHYSTRQH